MERVSRQPGGRAQGPAPTEGEIARAANRTRFTCHSPRNSAQRTATSPRAGSSPAAIPRPPLIFQRFPVTNREYIVFLDDLVATGREAEALLHVPQERPGQVGEQGAIAYGRKDDGTFQLVVDADGDAWLPDWPVCMVDWRGARTYAAWLAAKTGHSWRLPFELEWEKAARGVDGRFFPWGDFLDPSYCCMADSHEGHPLAQVIDSFPIDESVYGVRGMGGNMREWCADRFQTEGPPVLDHGLPAPVEPAPSGDVADRVLRAIRGGAWVMGAQSERCASRARTGPGIRAVFLGFRLARAPAGTLG